VFAALPACRHSFVYPAQDFGFNPAHSTRPDTDFLREGAFIDHVVNLGGLETSDLDHLGQCDQFGWLRFDVLGTLHWGVDTGTSPYRLRMVCLDWGGRVDGC